MSKLEGKVAFTTGAARGQGRAHALTTARAGAENTALESCRNLPYPHYLPATRADQDETVRKAPALGRATPNSFQVRSFPKEKAAVKKTVQPFGPIDILILNMAVCDMTSQYVAPREMHERAAGGILASSAAGLFLTGLSYSCAGKWR